MQSNEHWQNTLQHISNLLAFVTNSPIVIIHLQSPDLEVRSHSVRLPDRFHIEESPFFDLTLRSSTAVYVTDLRSRPEYQTCQFVTTSPHVQFFAGAPLVNGEGQPVGLIGLFDTILRRTDQIFKLIFEGFHQLTLLQIKQMHEQVRHQQITDLMEEQRLQIMRSAKLASLGEMAGGIAHEINNPLSSIMSRAGRLMTLAKRNEIDSKSIMDLASSIESTGERISKTVKALRSFAREEADAPFEPVRLQTLISDTISLCGERFRHNGVELRWKVDYPELEVTCRPVEICQVLVNLLNNAMDAVADLPERWVEAHVLSTGSNLEIRVTDSGTPPPQNIRSEIMKPFFTTKAIGKGNGLGLSISKRIVESHSGRLYLDSTAAHTTFVMQIPLITADEKTNPI